MCGTRIAEFCGNLTGQYLDGMDGADLWTATAYLNQYRIVVGQRRPVFSYDSMEGASGGQHYFQTGIWPLASDGANPDMCVAVEDYLDLHRADLKAGDQRTS